MHQHKNEPFLFVEAIRFPPAGPPSAVTLAEHRPLRSATASAPDKRARDRAVIGIEVRFGAGERRLIEHRIFIRIEVGLALFFFLSRRHCSSRLRS